MGLLLDLLALEDEEKKKLSAGGGAHPPHRYICAYCRTDLDPGETCPVCAARARRIADETALILCGAL